MKSVRNFFFSFTENLDLMQRCYCCSLSYVFGVERKKNDKIFQLNRKKFMTQFIQIFFLTRFFSFRFGEISPRLDRLVSSFVCNWTELFFFVVDYLDTIYHTRGVINGSFFLEKKDCFSNSKINKYGYVIYE